MELPYHFVDLDKAQLAHRRKLLDNYGQFAQISALIIPVLSLQVFFAARFIIRKIRNNNFQLSRKARQSPRVATFTKPNTGLLATGWSRLQWALDEDVAEGWGTRLEWIIAALWTSWLLLLVMKDTGDDYLHVTKRFGIVAASQLPFHYLLALKSWSPIQYLTRLSHEELNPYHRLLGRILISFFALHASLYLNFYVQKGLLSKRIRDSDVILGLSGITTFLILGTAALSKVRDYSYRIFFVSHVLLSIVLLPILYFHVSHLRVYILESAAIYIVLILQRNLSSTPVQATLTHLPQTSLLSLSLPLTRPLSKRTYHPGQHIYLSLPTSPSTPLNKLRLNPFTIANLPSHEPHIRLIIRALSGTTHLLSTLPPSPSLLIEGPYGSAPQFPNLVENYDRILLVAGGVGATFTLPIYRNILQHLRSVSSTTSTSTTPAHKIRFVWTVRAAADASWGMKQLHEDGEDAAPGFELYISGSSRATPRSTESDASIELQEREGLLGGDETDVAGGQATVPRRSRPDLKAVVDERFGHDAYENVAVLVCGPRGMGKALRKEVGRWVKRGREVFWHEEGFGW